MTTATKPLLTLHAGDHEAASALMPVSWCAAPELADYMVKHDVADPRLLVVVQSLEVDHNFGYKEAYWRDTGYVVAKLSQGFTHVTFRRPGKHRVTAVLVDVGPGESRKALRKLVRTGPYYGPDYSVIYFADAGHGEYPQVHAGAGYVSHVKYSQTVLATTVIDVDPQLFAEPLAPWRVWVAKRVFGDSNFRDECQARNRTLIWGPLFLPFVLLFANLGKLVASAGFLLFGARRPAWRELLRPQGKFWKDFIQGPPAPEADYSSFWWRKKPTDKQRDYDWKPGFRFDAPFSFVNICLSPPVLVLLPLVVFAVIHIFEHDVTTTVNGHKKTVSENIAHWTLAQTYLYTDLALVGAFAAVALFITAVVFLILGIAKLIDLIPGSNLKQRLVSWFSPRDMDASEEAVRRAVALATCGPDDDPRTSLRDVHIRQWTPRLVFDSAKATVCKPFAQ